MFEIGDIICDTYKLDKIIYVIVGKFDVGYKSGYNIKPLNKDVIENKVMNDDGTISYTYNYLDQFFVRV